MASLPNEAVYEKEKSRVSFKKPRSVDSDRFKTLHFSKSKDECEYLINFAKPHAQKSFVVDSTTANHVVFFVFFNNPSSSRAMELEKSGAISRSANFPLSSRSFRVDTSSNNNKASSLIQRESKQQDPYGIFDSEESIPRDIGPYKNLVMFTASNKILFY